MMGVCFFESVFILLCSTERNLAFMFFYDDTLSITFHETLILSLGSTLIDFLGHG